MPQLRKSTSTLRGRLASLSLKPSRNRTDKPKHMRNMRGFLFLPLSFILVFPSYFCHILAYPFPLRTGDQSPAAEVLRSVLAKYRSSCVVYIVDITNVLDYAWGNSSPSGPLIFLRWHIYVDKWSAPGSDEEENLYGSIQRSNFKTHHPRNWRHQCA